MNMYFLLFLSESPPLKMTMNKTVAVIMGCFTRVLNIWPGLC